MSIPVQGHKLIITNISMIFYICALCEGVIYKIKQSFYISLFNNQCPFSLIFITHTLFAFVILFLGILHISIKVSILNMNTCPINYLIFVTFYTLCVFLKHGFQRSTSLAIIFRTCHSVILRLIQFLVLKRCELLFPM